MRKQTRHSIPLRNPFRAILFGKKSIYHTWGGVTYLVTGNGTVRWGVRNGFEVEDVIIVGSTLGFDGTEGVDWANMSSNSIVYDLDGNKYTPIVIGTQTWLLENLMTTKYRDGSSIINITNAVSWQSDSAGAYCWYDNDIANKPIYGALYNWGAVNNVKNIAPIGWKVPSPADFDTLINYLGGNTDAGGKLKEAGLEHWTTPNTDADNSSGFTGIGSGVRSGATGIFSAINEQLDLWTNDNYSGGYVYFYRMRYNGANTSVAGTDKFGGLSVRLIKDV